MTDRFNSMAQIIDLFRVLPVPCYPRTGALPLLENIIVGRGACSDASAYLTDRALSGQLYDRYPARPLAQWDCLRPG